MKKELESCNFVSIATDASNHGAIKMFPVVVRYFAALEGLKTKVLDLSDQKGETADIIVNLLSVTANNYDIENKIVVFSGDNAPTNFGSVHRTGSKNVFKQLKQRFNANMIGAGCTAHSLHNAIGNASDKLDIDVEYIAVKIYTHFYRYTVRLNTLKDFCDAIGETYVKLKGYSKTRFLALKECLSSIIANFDALNEYFHSFDAPVKILEFFDDPFALVTLIFVRDQAENFQNAILRLEGDYICAVDACHTIDELKTNVKSRLQNNYFSSEFRTASEKVNNGAPKRKFMDKVKAFHRTVLKYLNDWTEWLDDVKVFSWIRLNNKVKWNDIECAALWMTGRNYFNSVDMDKLFNQFSIMEAFLNVNENSIKEEKATDKKWVKIFRHFDEKSVPFSELLKLVEFALVIPATNATVERVFSHINDIWTPEKGSLKIENVRSRLMVKFNWNDSCSNFYEKIKGDSELLRKVMGHEKYDKTSDLFKTQSNEQLLSTSTTA
ncbi:uncharacterized protein LOC116342721 [Contarinia nasturtii]|nr:uncharacterized protein LOC116342721 [Contarinia nasturtii]